MLRRAAALLALALCAACAPDDAAVDAQPAPRTFAERFAREHGRVALDYADPALWACTGDRDDDLCDEDFSMARRNTDGTWGVTPIARAEAPKADCFFIYPTLDFNILRGGVHDDFDTLALPDRTIQAQVGAFESVCRVFAPYYRQGTMGAYLTNIDYATWIFTGAFADVAAAFEYYLRHWNQGRPVVVIGHSQGAQHASYLLHTYFDGDAEVTDIQGSETTTQLRARLVAGLPLGSVVYVAKGKKTGGSFADIPVCDDDDAPGCVMAFRSFTEGFEFSDAWSPRLMQHMAREGLLYEMFDADAHEEACVNPGRVPLGADRALDWSGDPVAPGDVRVLEGTYMVGVMTLLYTGPRAANERLHLPGRYTATCRKNDVGGAYLAVGYHEPVTGADLRGDPVDIDGVIAHAGLGLHIFDFNLAQGELIARVAERIR